jgi:hypothetical protein
MTTPGIYLVDGLTQIPYTPEHLRCFTELNIGYGIANNYIYIIGDVWLGDLKTVNDRDIQALVALYQKYSPTLVVYVGIVKNNI